MLMTSVQIITIDDTIGRTPNWSLIMPVSMQRIYVENCALKVTSYIYESFCRYSQIKITEGIYDEQ